MNHFDVNIYKSVYTGWSVQVGLKFFSFFFESSEQWRKKKSATWACGLHMQHIMHTHNAFRNTNSGERFFYDRLDAWAFPATSGHVWLTLRKPTSASPKASKIATSGAERHKCRDRLSHSWFTTSKNGWGDHSKFFFSLGKRIPQPLSLALIVHTMHFAFCYWIYQHRPRQWQAFAPAQFSFALPLKDYWHIFSFRNIFFLKF